jgi:di/tricarboxylate transporter
MTTDQLLILLIPALAADSAARVLATVLAGLVKPAEAFVGFSHPAVITVACVLVLSRGLQRSGAVDVLIRWVLPAKAGVTLSIAALVALGALLSGFMNNVGAMALLMPVAIQLSRRLELTPGQVLMPLAYGTILGGMTTLIGTPPNLIVSGFRAQSGAGSFAMFDFSRVGLVVAVGGILFVVLLGWRLVPKRQPANLEGFESGAYITEVRVSDKSKTVGMTLREIEGALEEDVQILGLAQQGVRLTAPNLGRRVRAGDILMIEAEAEGLSGVLSTLGLQLEEAVASTEADEEEKPEEGKALPEEQAGKTDETDEEEAKEEDKAAG